MSNTKIEAAEQNNSQVLPVTQQTLGRLPVTSLTDQMFPGEDEPEHEEVGVEDSLLDVIEEVDPGHLIEEGAVLQGQVEEGEGEAQGEQHLLQEGGRSGQHGDSPPEPDQLGHDDGEEDGLRCDPDLREASVLVDGDQPEIHQFTEALIDVDGIVLSVEIDRGQSYVEEVIVVVESSQVKQGQHGTVVVTS